MLIKQNPIRWMLSDTNQLNYREDGSELIGVDVVRAEVAEHLRELYEAKLPLLVRVKVEAHGLHGGAP